MVESIQIFVVDQLLLDHVGQGEEDIAEIKLHPPFVLIAFCAQIVVKLPDGFGRIQLGAQILEVVNQGEDGSLLSRSKACRATASSSEVQSVADMAREGEGA